MTRRLLSILLIVLSVSEFSREDISPRVAIVKISRTCEGSICTVTARRSGDDPGDTYDGAIAWTGGYVSCEVSR